MRLLADLHIAPRTVQILCQLGHDVARVSDLAPPTLPDADIVSLAIHERRVVLTQDLDFSRLVALSGAREPSLISLRLSSSQIEHVNSILQHALPNLESVVPAMEPSSPSRITASESDVCHYNRRSRLCGSRCVQRLLGSSHRALELLLLFFFHPRDPHRQHGTDSPTK